MTIELTETERAQNVAFQIKSLILQLQTQIKPQLVNATVLMEMGTDGLSKETVVKALGDDAEGILEKVKTITAAL